MTPYRPLNIGLSPNTERDDILLAKKLLKNPFGLVKSTHHPNSVETLEEKIAELLPTKYTFAMRSGRSALYTALLAIDAKAGEEILLQSYTCAAVPNAVIWTGAKPVYVDIDEDTFNISSQDLEKKITARTKAVIAQHTFGKPADLRKIVQIAKKRNLILIEDCALALGAKYNGRHVGTFGDISIFSFGRDKVISGVTGGMIATNSFVLAERVKSIREKLLLPSAAWTAKQLLHPILMNHIILPTYNLASLGKVILESLKAVNIMPKVIYKSEKAGEKTESFLGLMPNALAILVLHQLKKLHRFNTHRRRIAKIYEHGLKALSPKYLKLPKPDKNSEHIYLRYTIQTPHAKEIQQAARKKNIILGDWYRPAIAPHGVDFSKMQYDPDTCPIAEHVSRQSLNLPTNINIKEADAEKIVKFIKDYLHDIHQAST